MKKLIFTMAFAAFFTTAFSQNGWEVPQNNNTSGTTVEKKAKKKTDKKDKAKAEKKVKTEKTTRLAPEAEIDAKDRPYMKPNSVPLNNGHVVYTLDCDAPGKSAQDIYDIIYAHIDSIAASENQINSRIVLINKSQHIIAAKFREWLVFSDMFLSLDRTEMDYTMLATCTDGHLKVTIERISYAYEKGNPGEIKESADKLIADKYCVNKKGTSLMSPNAKFRRKTIDRKNALFEGMQKALR